MKTKVRVKLVAETKVEIDVEHQEDEDPTDITREDKQRAIRLTQGVWAHWDVDDVDVA